MSKNMDYYKTISAPLKVQVEMTHNCNSKCLHCYNSRLLEKQQKFVLSKNQIDRIVEQLVINQVPSVTLTGGEPLLYFDELKYILSKLRKHNITCRLNSNLTLMTKEKAHILKELGIHSVLTSCISYDENTHDFVTQNPGSHKKFIIGIKHCIAEGIKTTINMVVSKYNYKDILMTGKMASELGAQTFTVTKATPPVGEDSFDKMAIDNLLDTIDQLIQIKEEYGINVDFLECYPLSIFPNENKYSPFVGRSCTAGITTCVIGADGQIRPCGHGFQVYGSVFEEELKVIWARMADWRRGDYLPEICKSCKILIYCSGGCRMEAYARTKNLAALDPWCTGANKDISKLLERETEEIEFDKKYKFIKKLFFREEKEGYIIVTEDDQTLNVSFSSILLIKYLSEQNAFSLSDVMYKFNIDKENLKSFFRIFLSKKIICEC